VRRVSIMRWVAVVTLAAVALLMLGPLASEAARVVVRGHVFLGPWWGAYPYPYWWYPPPYYYPPPDYYYTPPVVESPPVYIERPPSPSAPGEGYWHYCDSAKGYYPSVPSCPEPWILVPPRP
jgi:hypothetical protein